LYLAALGNAELFTINELLASFKGPNVYTFFIYKNTDHILNPAKLWFDERAL
jgi:hypothetical protein